MFSFRSLIRSLYSLVSALNTVSHILSGNPIRITKHIGRKRAHGSLSRWLK
jgi:hypothetical protein